MLGVRLVRARETLKTGKVVFGAIFALACEGRFLTDFANLAFAHHFTACLGSIGVFTVEGRGTFSLAQTN